MLDRKERSVEGKMEAIRYSAFALQEEEVELATHILYDIPMCFDFIYFLAFS